MFYNIYCHDHHLCYIFLLNLQRENVAKTMNVVKKNDVLKVIVRQLAIHSSAAQAPNVALWPIGPLARACLRCKEILTSLAHQVICFLNHVDSQIVLVWII